MMRRVGLATAVVALLLFATAFWGTVVSARAGAQPQANPDSWQIPPNAAAEENPVEPTSANLRKGAQLYSAKCARCHGDNGKGDGPDADPDEPPEDLTNPDRASRNPDGVMFYKVWNGRKKPKMPAFKTDMSKTDVWTVIQYVKKFRE